MGIRRLLYSSCCFLNTNIAITRRLIQTARTLEAEWWQILRESVGTGTKKMSQVLGAFGLLDFTMLRPFLAWRAFWNLWTVHFFNFPNIFSGRGEPRITETAYTESADTGILLYKKLGRHKSVSGRWGRQTVYFIYLESTWDLRSSISYPSHSIDWSKSILKWVKGNSCRTSVIASMFFSQLKWVVT